MRKVQVYPRVNPIVFGNKRPNRTADMGENVPPKPVFWLSFSRYGFFCGKSLKTLSGTLFPAEKAIFIFVVRRPVPSKMVMSSLSPHQKLFFAIILKNIAFYKKIIKWKIFKTSTPTKKVIRTFVTKCPPVLKTRASCARHFSKWNSIMSRSRSVTIHQTPVSKL